MFVLFFYSALSRSKEAYRFHQGKGQSARTNNTSNPNSHGAQSAQPGSKANSLPEHFSILLTGNHFEVEKFVHSFMTKAEGATAEDRTAYLKFLFVLLPLRSPTYFGLNPTAGLQLVTRILVTTANVYAAKSGAGAEEWKKQWMSAFADGALYMIQDEFMLKGMLTDGPTKAAVEALA